MTERVAAEGFPPGEYIRDELEARGWTQLDLAEILGKSITNISGILNGKIGISPETAKGLGEAFGTSAELWLRLDAQFRLRDARATPGTELRSFIYSKAPIREMIKRRWLEGSTNPEVLSSRLCQFLGIDSLDEEPRPFAHAARKATSYGEMLPSQMAWLSRVAQLAPVVAVAGNYAPDGFGAMISSLRTLVPNEADLRRVPRLLADYGIRFLVVEQLPQSKIDGVCVWLDKRSPVIALSLRYGRVDSFWHTLFHELGHVKVGDGQSDPPTVDSDLTFAEDGPPTIELAASRFAVETLIPAAELRGFIDRVGPLYSLKRIQGFASRIGVHPAIVVGQLAYRREINWSRFGSLMTVIRDHVTGTALTDGWGHVLPLLNKEGQTNG